MSNYDQIFHHRGPISNTLKLAEHERLLALAANANQRISSTTLLAFRTFNHVQTTLLCMHEDL